MISKTASDARVAHPFASRLRGAIPFAGQALAVVLIMFSLLQGANRNFHVPLGFGGSDSLVFLMQIKSTADHGWWWFNSNLSAPSAFNALLFPSNSNADQFLIWLVHLFTADLGFCANFAWLLMLALGANIATLCLLRLGVSRGTAFVVGALYGISPYALYRGIEHLSLVTYLVPIPCTAALLLASGRKENLWGRPVWLLLAGCAVVGLNYTYYAFFGAFLILVGTLIGFCTRRQRAVLYTGAMFLGVICLTTALNLTPSLYAFHKEGKPLIVRNKVPAEAEVFKRPGATALKRTREKRLNDLARNESDESRAALIGAM